MIITRAWAMPNKWTFSIKPIRKLLEKYVPERNNFIDPFCGQHSPAAFTNDIDKTNIKALEHMDALDYLKLQLSNSRDGILFDPPYSSRQVAECYKLNNIAVNMETTQSSFWSNCKKEISRIIKQDGIAITCGWNSGGIGKKYGFEIIEILLVAHGGWHNDTIVTVERKIK